MCQVYVKRLVENYVLARLSSYISLKQRRISIVFIEAQFGYCPLVWLFCERIFKRKINQLHERSLENVYRDSTSSFPEFLQKGHSFTVHHRNIQSLGNELYKFKESLSNEIMNRVSIRDFKSNIRTLYQI